MQNNTSGKIFRKAGMIIIFLVISFFMVVLSGCDEDDSYEARLEEARMALDEGDYSAAKAILLELPQTVEVKEALSSAIAGGDLNLDMFNIILTMDDLEEEGETGSIDMIGLIIGGGSSQLTGETLAKKLAAATEAIELYKDIAEMNGVGVEGLAAEQKLQLGLLCITRTVMTIGTLISDELPQGSSITLTKSWIRSNRDDFPALNPSAADLASIGEDILFTGYSISSMGDSNDVKDDYEEFQNELDSNGDKEMTEPELNAYIDYM